MLAAKTKASNISAETLELRWWLIIKNQMAVKQS